MENVYFSGYRFGVYAKEHTPWNNVGGLYVFAYYNGVMWKPVYIGQTDSFANRIPSHEKWEEAQAQGATCVLAMVVSSAEQRDDLERLLISQNRGERLLNQQLQSTFSGLSEFVFKRPHLLSLLTTPKP